jgi:hypothetical protein
LTQIRRKEGIEMTKFMMFRELSPIEEKEFRDAARKIYKPFTPISGIWHPIYQEECVKINQESAEFTIDQIDKADKE